MNQALSIIILNWKNLTDTSECIYSIIQGNINNIRIFLIDNGSGENEVREIKDVFARNPNIEIILNSYNLGFTKAHNQVLMKLIQDGIGYVFLLNNDTIVKEDIVKVLNECIERSGPHMLSCRMINYWNQKVLDNAGHRILSSGEIIPIGHSKPVERYEKSFENIGACAGAALYSTKMLKDIGFFDEYFITGYEDAELGLRAFIAGYKCLYEPKAIVYHKMGQSVKKIFNYNYVLKTQINIHYTYIKLVHWQVIAINLIPNILRFLIITLINIFFLRWRYFRIQYHALYIIFFKDWIRVMKARKESKRLRRIPWWKLLLKQKFFLKRDIINFYKFIIKGEKSYFEKY